MALTFSQDAPGQTRDQLAAASNAIVSNNAAAAATALPSLGSGTATQDLSAARGGTNNYSTSTGGLGGQDQSVQFGLALQNLLKQSQQLGTKSFVTQGLNASNAQQGAISAQAPQSLIGASPGQQDSVRSNQAQVFSPLISGANSAAQTFGEQLNSFGNQVNAAKSFMDSYQAQQQKAKADAQSIVHDAIASGSDAIDALIKSQPDVVKLAGYNNDTLQGVITGLKRTEAEKAATAQKTALPTSAQEYEYAKANGFTGTYTQYQNEDANRKARAVTGNPPIDPNKVKATPASVQAFLLANKKANPSVAYYDLWGQLADQLKAEGINPANYDKEFWSILSPDGLAGYQKNVIDPKKKNSSTIVNPFAPTIPK